jgi:hypothetical protein
MSGEIAIQIIGIFFGLFAVIVAVVLWFTKGMAKDRNVLEIKKKKIDVIDKHFNEMVRVECPYCKTIYKTGEPSCPGCGANTKNILLPELPE